MLNSAIERNEGVCSNSNRLLHREVEPRRVGRVYAQLLLAARHGYCEGQDPQTGAHTQNDESLWQRAAESTSSREQLSSKSLELIRQHGIARAAENHQQTSELAKLCREAIKEDLKERRAAVMDEAAEAGKSIRKARELRTGRTDSDVVSIET
ncbi:hypothetical protein V3C99_018651 [Haemonchus contortus]